MAAQPQSLHNERGFLLVEVLAVAFILLGLTAIVLPRSNAYVRQCAKLQVRTAANLLASDMRKLQQQALFGEGEQRYLRSLSTGYDFYERGKKIKQVRFADKDWDIVLSWPKRFNVQFGVNGGPSATGTWVLRHNKLRDFSCEVAVQPVTGRIVISEGK